MKNKQAKYAVSIDVGGTTIDAACVKSEDDQLNVVGFPFSFPSPSGKSATEILSIFRAVISEVIEPAATSGIEFNAIGIGMPGPFDYKKGIFLMTGENKKFAQAYRMNLKEPLENHFDLTTSFINDADALGLGVFTKLYPNEKRLMVITIGTGLGSSFIVDGKLREDLSDSEQEKIPAEGIWNLLYQGDHLEQFASKRAIEKDYTELTRNKIEVIDIANFAKDGQLEAQKVFENMAKNLAYGVANTVKNFKPTRIVFGGQISKSLGLFEKSFTENLEKNAGFDVPISGATDENYAIYGAAENALRNLVT